VTVMSDRFRIFERNRTNDYGEFVHPFTILFPLPRLNSFALAEPSHSKSANRDRVDAPLP
jgi:hypothetical protein